jgi:hypothetical protein
VGPRELLDRLYCCLLGHLFHLARGELLRLGAALHLPEAAASAAAVLQLSSKATAEGMKAIKARKSVQQQAALFAPSSSGSSSSSGTDCTAGADLLADAAAAGILSPWMVAQLQVGGMPRHYNADCHRHV